MSDLRRIINYVINVETGEIVISITDITPDPRQQTYTYGTQLLFRVTLINSDMTAFKPPAASTFLFGMDTDYTAGQADKVISLHDQFNILADWSEVDVANGKICWRADLSTDALKAAFTSTTDPNLTMHAVLFYAPPGGKYVPLLCWDPIVKNLAVDPYTAVAVTGITHVTTDQLKAILEQYTNEAGQHKLRFFNDLGGTVGEMP